MDRKLKRAAALLLALLMAVSLLPTAAFAADSAPVNLLRPNSVGIVGVESREAGDAREIANHTVDKLTDGDATRNQGHRWESANLKSGVPESDDVAQDPVYVQFDLGANTRVADITQIKLYYQDNMVWPTKYQILTADSPDATTWRTIASVTRSSYNGKMSAAFDAGQLGQEDGQNIVSIIDRTTLNPIGVDTITLSSTPSIQTVKVGRYIRLNFDAVNRFAGGNNTGVLEFELMGHLSEAQEDPIEGAYNLAKGRTVSASSSADNTSPENAVDGNITDTQWNSGDLKNFVGTDADPGDDRSQTPQWLLIDLGASGSQLSEIKLHYIPNNKVWAMAYRIETTDDPENGPWRTIVSVSRPSVDKQFQALDPATDGCLSIVTNQGTVHADVITRTSTPRIDTSVAVGRYIRLYVEKTNTRAPAGNNVNLREIEIFGVNDNLHTPVDVAAELGKVTSVTVNANDTEISLPTPSRGATLTVAGSTLENVVANGGSIGGKNIGAREVTLLIRAWDNESPADYQQKNLTVTVPDHKGSYPAAWFPAVTSPNPKPEVIPAIQEWYGYNGSFTLSEASRIVVNDAAGVGLQKAAENMKADLLEITGLDLPIAAGTSGTADDIYIESLTADRYDLGKEGYLMRVSGEGVQIYAPTYTGCLFGTITVEQILWQAADHASIPMGIMRDYPAYAVRGVKLDIARTPYRYQQLKDYAKIMLWYKMSEYDLHVNDNDNANIAKGQATMDTHSGFHRLESETFPSLAKSSGTKHAGIPAEAINADYYNKDPDYGGNPTYTKEEWRALEQLTEDYGMYLLTELDLPAHSLVYNKYAMENPDNIDWLEGGTMPAESFTSNAGYLELLDLTGSNKERALRLATALWDEYTSGSEPTIYGDIVHIGADEYWVHDNATNNAFAKFADTMRQTIQGNLGADTKIRMWGASAGNGSFRTATTALGMTHAQLAEHYQLDVWHTNYENPAQRAKEGYGIVNCRDSFLYGNPGRSGRDVPNAEYLFNSWNPTMFGGNTDPLPGEPNLLGAKAVIWGDQSQEGMTELDIHQRVLRAIAIVSEKTWGGATHSEGQFSHYELRAARLAEGPGTQIAMEVPSKSSLVLAYDFTSNNMNHNHETVYDLSGNGYNATLEGGFSADGCGDVYFGGSAVLKTPIKTLSYPYTVSLDVKVSSADANNTDAALFSGYDGRIRVKGSNGNLCADVNYFTRDLGYALTSEKTTLTIVGTQQATRLYVNGQLITFLSQKADEDGVAPNSIHTLYSSVPLPLEKIGEGFRGFLSHLRVYNKALSADEVAALYAGTDDGKVNVAQNAIAGGSSPEGSNDNNVQRNCYAAKAIDGEEEELWSDWRADGSGNTLTVDLGESHPVSRIEAKWRGAAPGFTLQTSPDGKTWAAFTQGTAADARFVKLTAQGAGNLTELLVYEAVDKTALAELLTYAEEFLDPGSRFDTIAQGIAYPPVALARAVQENPLATNAEVAEAVKLLEDAIDALHNSDDATLSALTLSAGTLSPAFSPDVLNYTASVANSVAEITVTPTTADPNASAAVLINNVVHLNAPLTGALKVGENSIQVRVTAPNHETERIYTITLTRAASSGGSTGGGNSGGSTSGGGSTTPPEPVTEARFEDVPETHWAYEAIQNIAALKLVEGIGGGKYDPVAPMTRGSLATVLHRLSQGKTDYETTFKDVAEGKYYTEGVAWAAQTGVVTGYTEEIFAPDDVITREQLAVMLARYAKLIGMDTKADSMALDQFADGDSTGDWAVDGVAWCVTNGILKGKGNDILDPTANVTRAEVAVMFDRFIGLIK